MAKPQEIASLPGDGDVAGKQMLPWALDTLDVCGGIRGRLIRLQDWVNNLGDEHADTAAK